MPFNSLYILDASTVDTRRQVEWAGQRTIEYEVEPCSELGQDEETAVDPDSYGEWRNLIDQKWFGLFTGCDCRGKNHTSIRRSNTFITEPCNFDENLHGCEDY